MIRAIRTSNNGLIVDVMDRPKPGPDEVLIRNHAIGLNRADLAVVAGQMHGNQGGLGTIPGMESSGVVEEVGSSVSQFHPGDRVMASGIQAYADYMCTHQARVMLIPDNMDFERAASFPIALMTMHNSLIDVGGMTAGAAVLIQGASSAVGLMAMKIAKLLGAGLVIGSSTTAEKRKKLHQYGADLAIDSSDPNWVQEVLNVTEQQGVDLIIDQISGAVARSNLKATKIQGTIVNVGRLGGGLDQFDFDLHALRRINYIGVTFRTRSMEEIGTIVQNMQANLWSNVIKGDLDLPIDQVFSLQDVEKAVAHMKDNKHMGKIIMKAVD